VAGLVDVTRLSKYGFMAALELRAPQKAAELIIEFACLTSSHAVPLLSRDRAVRHDRQQLCLAQNQEE